MFCCFRKRCSLVLYLLLVVLFGSTVFIFSSLLSSNESQPRQTYHHAKKITSKKFVPLINCTALCSTVQTTTTTLAVAQRPNNASVSKLPPVQSIESNNDSTVITRSSNVIIDYPLTWTTVDATGTTIFSAYYDERPQLHGPSVVILGYQSRDHEGETLYCLFKYGDGTLNCRSKSIYFEMDECNHQKETHKKKMYRNKHVFHICALEPQEMIPTQVALSYNQQCNPSCGFITVNHHRPKSKAHIGVCIETPIFKKNEKDVVNFIEMNLLLGVDIFTMYLLDFPAGGEEFINKLYNQDDNKIVDIVHWSDSFRETDPLHYYGEILAIQDCLYRNMHRVDYLVLIDLDELIITRRHNSLASMLAELDKDYIDSFIFINSVYLKTPDSKLPLAVHSMTTRLCNGQSLPDYYLHFQKSKCRYHYYERSKLIIKPTYVIDTDIHGICTHLNGKTHFFVPDDMATSHHYREKPTIECRKNRKTKKYDTEYDDWLMKYSEPFLTAVTNRFCKKSVI